VLLIKVVLYIIYPFKLLYKAIRQAYISLERFSTTYYKEILLVLCWIIGWTLLTHGISLIIGEWFYFVSFGILFLGICGYKFIYVIFKEGFYTLSE
jgi:hypothetical protein